MPGLLAVCLDCGGCRRRISGCFPLIPNLARLMPPSLAREIAQSDEGRGNRPGGAACAPIGDAMQMDVWYDAILQELSEVPAVTELVDDAEVSPEPPEATADEEDGG